MGSTDTTVEEFLAGIFDGMDEAPAPATRGEDQTAAAGTDTPAQDTPVQSDAESPTIPGPGSSTENLDVTPSGTPTTVPPQHQATHHTGPDDTHRLEALIRQGPTAVAAGLHARHCRASSGPQRQRCRRPANAPRPRAHRSSHDANQVPTPAKPTAGHGAQNSMMQQPTPKPPPTQQDYEAKDAGWQNAADQARAATRPRVHATGAVAGLHGQAPTGGASNVPAGGHAEATGEPNTGASHPRPGGRSPGEDPASIQAPTGSAHSKGRHNGTAGRGPAGGTGKGSTTQGGAGRGMRPRRRPNRHHRPTSHRRNHSNRPSWRRREQWCRGKKTGHTATTAT